MECSGGRECDSINYITCPKIIRGTNYKANYCVKL